MGDCRSLIIVLVLVGLFFIFYSCVLNSEDEKYLSLPFAGGDVRSFQKDPHMIEDPLWKAMDSVDSSQGSGDYPI